MCGDQEAKVYFGLKGTIREFDKHGTWSSHECVELLGLNAAACRGSRADFVKSGANKADVIQRLPNRYAGFPLVVVDSPFSRGVQTKDRMFCYAPK